MPRADYAHTATRLPLPMAALPLPPGIDAERLERWVRGIRVDGAPESEMTSYVDEDFRRFVLTYGLARGEHGRCLEIGANPYFTTMLLTQFTELEVTCTNYFGPHFPRKATQTVTFIDLATGEDRNVSIDFDHFNTEDEAFPYPDGSFDVVIFCEVIEHLTNDPVRVLREIKRVLVPGGKLIVSTPNVARLENVARLVSGENLYDPYSGYGPYGRHNREYNRHELGLLLEFAGFDIEELFSADVHVNRSALFADVDKLAPLVAHRIADLGQYLLLRGVNARPAKDGLPGFLYRSYGPGIIDAD